MVYRQSTNTQLRTSGSGSFQIKRQQPLEDFLVRHVGLLVRALLFVERKGRAAAAPFGDEGWGVMGFSGRAGQSRWH
jgi:hypothetical protein